LFVRGPSSIHIITCAGSVNPATDRLLRAAFGYVLRNFLQSGSTSPDYVQRPRFVDLFDKSKIAGGLRVSQLPSAGGSGHRLLAYASKPQSRSSITARPKGPGSMYQEYLLKSTDDMLWSQSTRASESCRKRLYKHAEVSPERQWSLRSNEI
jgi:hypothetical protein